MTRRFEPVVWEVTSEPEGTALEDYMPAGEGLLVPRHMGVVFRASARQEDPMSGTFRTVAKIEGAATIENGVASIFGLNIDTLLKSADPDEPDPEPQRISDEFLKRINMADLGFHLVARCSLTRWQEAHYSIEPLASWIEETGLGALEQIPFFMRQTRAVFEDQPIPTRKPPKPVLMDGDGIPWYRVQVVEKVRRDLPWRRNARITPEFLRELWTVYSATRERGEPTTEAIRDWADLKTGRIPSNPTIFRWIKEARAMYGEESKDA